MLHQRVYLILCLLDVISAIVQSFIVEAVSSNTVRLSWTQVDTDVLDRYNLYYYPTILRNDTNRSQNLSEIQLTLPARSSSWLIGGLEPEKDYVFALTVVIRIGEIVYEGDRKELQYTLPGLGWQPVNYTYLARTKIANPILH